MVIQTKQGTNSRKGANQFGCPTKKDFSVVQLKQERRRSSRLVDVVVCSVEEVETVDVIDLGAPRRLRHAPPALPPPPTPPPPRPRTLYTPNPRLYPGPSSKPKRRPKRTEVRARRTRRHVFRRPVPNSRLYRPAPRRLPPPATPPRGPWTPPAPALDTASRAALRLAARRAPPPHAPPAPHAPHAPPAPHAPHARRLVVTLPAAGAGMDAAARHSTSPDDCSDADALSAPSEFLAEFLSAIMRRQYAEALKYCRLILQYEPHNATARGFYPLLRHKVQALKRNEGAEAAAAGGSRGSSSGSSAYAPAQQSPHKRSLSHSHSHSHSNSSSQSRSHQLASPSSVSAGGAGGCATRAGGSWAGSEAESESEGSAASQSSLELDSSSDASRSASASPARDLNGNPPPTPPTPPPRNRSDDLKNDNDVSQSHLKTESSASLRRLRAQFACSIK